METGLPTLLPLRAIQQGGVDFVQILATADGWSPTIHGTHVQRGG